MRRQIRKGLRLPKSLIVRIEKAAQEECSTFSQFIRTAVVKQLNGRKKAV